jgi:hypothetical protein
MSTAWPELTAERDRPTLVALHLFSQVLGQVTLAWILSREVIGHTDNITGEISCLKGLQGRKGYPT